jgi:hypothetical protein
VSFTALLDGSASKPQQAMLVAASKAHPGLAAYAVAKARKDGGHVASLSTSTIEKQLGSLVRGGGLGGLRQIAGGGGLGQQLRM